MPNFQTLSSLIWNVADDVLRGLFKPHEYGDVVTGLFLGSFKNEKSMAEDTVQILNIY